MRDGARRRSILFLRLAALGVAVAAIGFGKTFFYPLVTGTFRADPMVYVHGIFLFGWVGFFLSQSVLIHKKRLRLHKQIGWAGAFIAAGVVLTTLYVAVLASRRSAAGGSPAANGELLVIMIEMLVFGALITAAIQLRRKPEAHKRLMLLALIASLGPAWFRFRHYFPEVSNPLFFYSVLIADSLIAVGAIADYLREKRVHPIYIFVGGGMFLVHLVEVFAFDTAAFQVLADLIAGPLI
ncbi:hypothetical protein V6R86_00235 [Sphingomonas kaistensis]|uniref:Uncharacterized protein n=1 Tax=Sphingomonas kaistensis TaxID=298708 RepID=A0ABZ2FZM0_9SPHN